MTPARIAAGSAPRAPRAPVALWLLAIPLLPLGSQVTYTRAERFLPWNTTQLIAGDEVRASWMQDGNRFWYRNKTATGADFVVIDPAANSRSLLFDNTRLAAAMSMANDTSYDPSKLPFRTFRFTNDGKNEREIEFTTGRRRFVCNVGTYQCAVRDTTPSETPFVLSPDKKTEAFVHKYNVYVRPRGGGDSTQLTTDGVKYWSYGLSEPRPSQLQMTRPPARRPNIRWSPDSRKLVVSRADERRVAHMPYISYTSQRPRAFSQPYALPGDTIVPLPGLHIIDVAAKTNVAVAVAPRPNQLSFGGSARDSSWSVNSDKLYVTWFTRGSKSAYLGVVDARSGSFRVVARDSSKTFVEIGPPTGGATSWYVTKDDQDLFWWSERDGWSHLYRLDAAGVATTVAQAGTPAAPPNGAKTNTGTVAVSSFRSGTVKNQITVGAWNVSEIEYVDETAKQIYFTARGKEPGRLLYYAHLYRANYDGSNLTLITPEDAHHDIQFSPSGKYFVDSYSRIEKPPVTVLRAIPDGRVIRKLEEADVSRLQAIGWRPARTFTVKARDGLTDLYGVMYLPPDIDPSKKYPIIDHIYPGPQVGSVGQWNFKGGSEAFALAELGFVVIQLDHLGTPLRSKAFHDNYYGNFGDNGLPDHVAAIKQLAATNPMIDLERVGIFGHSGGGFASTDAILRYPDFFKVAVSGAGNHDNRSYNIYWAEKYQGLMQRDSARRSDNFAESANKAMAKNLRGHLLLMHGDMDDNVHPAMTIQLVDELIKANKSFDLIIAPNRNHGLNEPYFIRRRWDYFVQHLLGEKPPVNYEIVRPVGAGGGGDAQNPPSP
ncbi:MAG: DPP IV N-terminal domain-containing protein [Gemmatimonadaceae bacterium]